MSVRRLLLAATGVALGGILAVAGARADVDPNELEPVPKPPFPTPESVRGGWRVEMTASYSSCDDVKPGAVRKVEWMFQPGKKAGSIDLTESGGQKGDATRYSGAVGGDGRVSLRAGKQAGLELTFVDDRVAGRHVVVRKGNCAVVFELAGKRRTDLPLDLGGGGDPDAGKFGLAQALAGLPQKGTLTADIDTAYGTLTCDLYPDAAPETVANFVGLARGLRAWRDGKDGRWWRYRPFYDGQSFHRLIPGFIIQAGDPFSVDLGSPQLGTGGPGYTVPDEAGNGLRFDVPGRLAMANRAPGTNSGGSQFFITEIKASQLDGSYAIFGQCGPLDVVQKLARVPADKQSGKPTQPVLLRVRIYKR